MLQILKSTYQIFTKIQIFQIQILHDFRSRASLVSLSLICKRVYSLQQEKKEKPFMSNFLIHSESPGPDGVLEKCVSLCLKL